jgi:hypothetical protein
LSFFKDFNGALEKYLEYKYQNYTIAYKSDFARKICIIRKFIKIDGSLFCIIQNLEKSSNFIEDSEENVSVVSLLDRFFLLCKIVDGLSIIRIEQIISKCVLLVCNDEFFVSIFNENDAIAD